MSTVGNTVQNVFDRLGELGYKQIVKYNLNRVFLCFRKINVKKAFSQVL